MNDMFEDLFVNIFREIAAWKEEIIIILVAVAAFYILGWWFDLDKI